MKIELIVVGKTTTPYLKEGIEHYVKRLTHYVPYEIRTISDIKTSKALTAERQKEMEGEFILQQIQPGDRVVLLDEHGRQMTFSHEMIRLFFTEQVYRAMTILRGEPYHHD